MSRNNKKGSTTSKRKVAEAMDEGEAESTILTQKPKNSARGPAVKKTKNADGEAKTSEVAVAQKVAAGKKLWREASKDEASLDESSVPLNSKEDIEHWLKDNLLIHKRKSTENSKGGRWDLRIFKDGLGQHPEDMDPLADRVGLPIRIAVKRPHQMFSKPKQWDNPTPEGQPKVPPKKNDHLLKPWTSSLPLDFVTQDSEDHLQYDIHKTLWRAIVDYLVALPLEEKMAIFGPVGDQITEAWFEPDREYWKYPISNWGEGKDRWDLRIKFDTNSFTKQPNYVIYDMSEKSRKMKQPPMISPSVMGDGAGLFGTYGVSGFYVMQDWKVPLGGDKPEYQGFYVGYTASWIMAFHLDSDTMRAKGFSRVTEGNDRLVADFKKDNTRVQRTLQNMWANLDRLADENQKKSAAQDEAEEEGVPVYVPPRTKGKGKGKGKEKESEKYNSEELESSEDEEEEAEEN